MSGFQDFVGSGAECSGINPTRQLVNHLDKDRSFHKNLNFLPGQAPIQAPPKLTQDQKLAENFFNEQENIPIMQAPPFHDTFNFKNFSNELENIAHPMMANVNNINNTNIKMDNWANDFMNEVANVKQAPVIADSKFSLEFQNQQKFSTPPAQFNTIYPSVMYQNPMQPLQFQTPYLINNNVNNIRNVEQTEIDTHELDKAFENAKLLSNNLYSNVDEEASKWVDEFEKQELTNEDNDSLAETAKLLLETVESSQNPKFKESKFMNFMKQLRDHEVTVKGNKVVPTSSSQQSLDQTLNNDLHMQDENISNIEEVTTSVDVNAQSNTNINAEQSTSKGLDLDLLSSEIQKMNEQQHQEEIQNNMTTSGNIDSVNDEMVSDENYIYDKTRFGELHTKKSVESLGSFPSNERVWEEVYSGQEESDWANYFMGEGEDEEPVMWGDSYQQYVAEEIRKEALLREQENLSSSLSAQASSSHLNNNTYDNASINIAESSNYSSMMNETINIPETTTENDILTQKENLDISDQATATSSAQGDRMQEEKSYNLADWVRDYQNSLKDIDIDQKNKEWAGIDNSEYSESSLRASENLYGEYIFQKNNHFLKNQTIPSLDEVMRMQNLIESILGLEAIVQNDPSNYEAWLLLGTRQQENEREPHAIAALKKAVEINPKALDAWLALAISYSNENYIENSYDALESWLMNSEKYSHLLKKFQFNISEANDRRKFITNLFLECARFRPGADLDSDVQIALGLLFNMSEEYDKAIDCFSAAISKRPNDHMLYNRLGAILANNNEIEKAIEAYFHALEINPSFIRARYNLAISCMNIGEVHEAAEHLLEALSIQSGNNDLYETLDKVEGNGAEAMSTSVWETLRVALNIMGRNDLLDKCDSRDLEFFRNHFEF